MSALSPYLLNESLGAANPHGPGQHSDRTYVDVVPAELFSGTKATFATHSVITLTNNADTTLSGTVRVPKGALSLDNIQIVVVEKGGVAGAGNARLAAGAKMFAGGDDASPGAGLTSVSVAIPAEVIADVIRVLSLTVLVLPANLTGDFIQVRAFREGTDGSDTFEDDLHFVALVLTWTVDE